jgi:CDP-glucose 4,6-dehydratase
MKNDYGSNILVTGGTGFVGSHLVHALVKNHARVIVTYRASDPSGYFFRNSLDKKVILASCDLSDFDRVHNIITRYTVDTICHLGAQAIVETSYRNPREAIITNVIGTTNILEAARISGHVEKIIVASSDKAYGKILNAPEVANENFIRLQTLSRNESVSSIKRASLAGEAKQNFVRSPGRKRLLSYKPYTESDPLAGDHPYEVSKSAADLIAQMYSKTYALPVVITRFGNIYGPGDLNFNRLIPGIMRSLITGEKLVIRSDGTFVRDYVYAGDVVSGYLFLLAQFDRVRGQAYNLSSDVTLSVTDVLKQSQRILGKKIRYEIQNTQKNEIPYQHLSFEKIKKLGWKPRTTFARGMKETYRWYKRALKTDKSLR